ncbi:hypothetical protein [Leisingera methylohalidivorans]|uniref:hypothetical protein n=1 Tax=Leisingera methylohalidivorans TaxID=133924 RepID=UPI001FE1FD39|nr:hypothetical protein [Leisingera methylohalidivorans]
MAIPTARTCDSEDTEPITSSGDGIARAATGNAEKSEVSTVTCAERRKDLAVLEGKLVFFTAVPVAPVETDLLTLWRICLKDYEYLTEELI